MTDGLPDVSSAREAWERLEAHLAWADGSWVAFVFCPDGFCGAAAERAIRVRAERTVRSAGGTVRTLAPPTPSGLRSVVRSLVGRGSCSLTWLVAIGEPPGWNDAWTDVLLRLNERRERLMRSLEGGLVIVAPARLKSALRAAAPDLWSVRALVLDLAPEPPRDEPHDNAWQIATGLLRFQFHNSMRRDAWFAQVVGPDPVPKRRLLDALVAAGHRALVHDGWSAALTEPTDADLHWIVVGGDVDPKLRDACVGIGPPLSAPTLLETSAELDAPTGRCAFVIRTGVDGAIHPRALPELAGEASNVREAEAALQAARGLEAELPSLRGRAGTTARFERARALRQALESLLGQGWATEAEPIAQELLHAVSRLPERRHAGEELRADADELAGRVSRQLGDLAAARDSYRAAIPRRRRLATQRGEERLMRRAELARCLSVSGELALAAGDLDEARALVSEALAIRRRLARATDDHETLADLATAWSMQGDLHAARHEAGDRHAEQALDAWREALRLREHVAGHEPSPRFLRLLSVALGRLGSGLARAGDANGAHRAWARSSALANTVASLDSGNVAWRMEASVAASRLGDAARSAGRVDEAAAAYRDAVRLRSVLLDEDPENARWRELLAVALGRQADLALQQRDLALAARSTQWAVTVSEQLVWTDPGNVGWRRALAAAWMRRGDLEEARHESVAARAAWDRSSKIASELLGAGPEGRRRAQEILGALEARGARDPSAASILTGAVGPDGRGR